MENEEITQLKPMQVLAAQLLAAGSTVSDAALKAGCGRQTVHRWIKEDDAFLAFLNSLMLEQIEATQALLRLSAAEAVKIIKGIMGQSQNDSTRLAAAIKLLEMSGAVQDVPHRFDDSTEGLRRRRILADQCNF